VLRSRRSIGLFRFDDGNQSIPLTAHGFDVSRLVSRLTERTSQHFEPLREVFGRDLAPRPPNGLGQLIVREQIRGRFDERKQEIERELAERYLFVAAPEPALTGIERQVCESIPPGR
jgi:hypothetical protein